MRFYTSAKCVSKCFNVDKKCDLALAPQAVLDRFRWDPVGLFNRLVTMDKTWIHVRI
jgi:hypothetical protein